MRSILLFLALMVVARANGQVPGSVDPVFNASDVGYGRDGFLGYVQCNAIHAERKILISGHFVSRSAVCSGAIFTNIKRLARLNSDGTSDPTFSVGTGFDEFP